MYYLLLRDLEERTAFIAATKEEEINCVFHYAPLHSSPAGQRYGKESGESVVTDLISMRLVLYIGLTESQQTRVIDVAEKVINGAMLRN